MADQPRSQKQVTIRDILGTAAVQQETLLYVFVSSLDLFMTYIMLSQGGGTFVEANPVARFFIAEWGAKGMVYFKFSMVAFVCVLAQIIARYRPRSARWILLGATMVVAVVVVYSMRLLLQHGNLAEIDL